MLKPYDKTKNVLKIGVLTAIPDSQKAVIKNALYSFQHDSFQKMNFPYCYITSEKWYGRNVNRQLGIILMEKIWRLHVKMRS